MRFEKPMYGREPLWRVLRLAPSGFLALVSAARAMRMSPPRLAGRLAILMLLTVPAGANAYMGPGLGLGMISVALGFFGSIILGFFAILWYPIKRFLRRRRQAASPLPAIEAEEPGE